MSIVSVDNIQPIGSGTTVTVNKSVTLESGNTNITGVCTATSFSGSGANLTSLPAQATIANNADNRIITGGSGVNLNGEANLIFNGTELYPDGASNTDRDRVGHRLNYRRNPPNSRTNTGSLSQRYYKIGQIVFNGSESAEINIYGTVGYSAGTESAGKTTIIMRATNGGTLVGFWYEESLGNINLSDVRWKYTGSNNVYELWVQANNYSNIAPFVRCTGNGYTSFNEDTGSNTAPSGSTAFSTYNRKVVGTTATIRYNPTDTTFHQNIKMDSGKGIDFTSNSNASGVSSEILDDYEEGSWTPVLQYYGGGAFQNVTMTTYGNLDTPRYTKIGRLVHATFNWTGFQINGSHLAYPRVTGLPFTSTAYGSAVVSYHNCFGNTQTQGAWLANGQVSFEFYVNGGSWNTWNGSSNRYFQVSCTYQAT